MPEVVTLTINPSIDVSTSVERVTPVRKLRCRSERRDPGGGGINVARVLHRFGVNVLAAFPTGGVIGLLLQQRIDNERIPSRTVAISGETREDFTVFEENSGQPYRFVLPGPQLSEAEWRECLDTFTSFDIGPRFVVASGSLPPGAPADFYARIGSIVKAKGSNFIIDSSGPALKCALKESVYLIKPNLCELQDLVSIRLENRQRQIEASRQLVEQQRAEVVALTLGNEGALLVTRDQGWLAEAVPVEAVSRVGAGDSFLGAMIWALVTGHNIENAFRYGVAAGAAALLTPGTDLCHRDDVERLHHRVKLQVL